MEMTFVCPSCGHPGTVDRIEPESAVACASCGRAQDLRPAAFSTEGLQACPACGTEDLYIQKDFPQGLGLLIVLVGFAISTVFWYYRMALWAYAVLLASALLDLVLYYKVPDVTICYRCLAQCRGPGSNPGGRFAPFDLAIGERYRQERLRVEELRSRTPPDRSPPPSA